MCVCVLLSLKLFMIIVTAIFIREIFHHLVWSPFCPIPKRFASFVALASPARWAGHPPRSHDGHSYGLLFSAGHPASHPLELDERNICRKTPSVKN